MTRKVVAAAWDIGPGGVADAAATVPGRRPDADRYSAHKLDDDRVDAWGRDSFPASDPPSNW